MGNQIRETIWVHLAKRRKGFTLTSPSSDPRAHGFAAFPALPVLLCRSAEGASQQLPPGRHPQAKGPGAEGTVRAPHGLGGVEKGPVLPFIL